ncbi:FkbM family methyltransferase [Mucilaginibacter sp.]|jgi:FkbM family methyltransferase|uniref:FkbM family methyltransferase n=1 Tax=Mucilaginibacter sp. TaxID=1882438 RepID=UPI002B9D38F1|nr:FkbM family methyltransferase [Mucilaginibacter sp.]HTI60217.1 FkbM family methyltransferase [Mucilaginibacter sp.]
MSINLSQIISEFLSLPASEQQIAAEAIREKNRKKNAGDYNDPRLNEELSRKAGMSSAFRAQIGEYARAILVSAKTGQFLVDPEDYEIGYRLRTTGSYGDDELARIKNLVAAGSNVLVIGAHVGTLAIPIAKTCGDVTAIEANPNTFRLLEMNILLNDVQNCTAINLAANDNFEEISFIVNRVNSGGSKRKPLVDNFIYTYDNPAEIIVRAAPLDDLLAGTPFEIIIMDIEGSEYFALRGMQNLLRNSKTLIVEFIPHHLQNVSAISVDELLGSIPGFRFLTVPSKGIKVPENAFSFLLNNMYYHNISDDGIIFSRN